MAFTINDLGALDSDHRQPPARRRVLETSLGRVVDSSVSANEPPPSGWTRDHQVVLPYEGVFAYRVGRRSDVFDAGRTLYAVRGEEFADSHVVDGVGHSSLVVSAGSEVLERVFLKDRVERQAFFVAGAAPATGRLQVLTHKLRRAWEGTLEIDELVHEVLLEASRAAPKRSAGTSRLVEQATALMHSDLGRRRTLASMAASLGVSPIYLTDTFRRYTGRPLYAYQRGLRLSEALNRLPQSDEITMLALDLGFSSHSHFSASFKAAFGVTPEAWRAECRSVSGFGGQRGC